MPCAEPLWKVQYHLAGTRRPPRLPLQLNPSLIPRCCAAAMTCNGFQGTLQAAEPSSHPLSKLLPLCISACQIGYSGRPSASRSVCAVSLCQIMARSGNAILYRGQSTYQVELQAPAGARGSMEQLPQPCVGLPHRRGQDHPRRRTFLRASTAGLVHATAAPTIPAGNVQLCWLFLRRPPCDDWRHRYPLRGTKASAWPGQMQKRLIRGSSRQDRPASRI